MAIEVTARHMDATKEIQEYAKNRAEEMVEEFSGIEYVHVILDVERHMKIAEVVVQMSRHGRIEAKESSDNMRASLDAAIDKTTTQLGKIRDRIRDHAPAMKHEEDVRSRGVTS